MLPNMASEASLSGAETYLFIGSDKDGKSPAIALLETTKPDSVDPKALRADALTGTADH